MAGPTAGIFAADIRWEASKRKLAITAHRAHAKQEGLDIAIIAQFGACPILFLSLSLGSVRAECPFFVLRA
jgi:hypothetical protein